jgi:prepilin peptidase CpaA
VLAQIGLATAIGLVFAGCFFLGWMGGGDVKLLAALALWLPLEKMAGLLVWMAVGGGVLTLAMLIAHRLRRAEGRPEIPYGVAIVGAALLVLTNDILTTPVA